MKHSFVGLTRYTPVTCGNNTSLVVKREKLDWHVNGSSTTDSLTVLDDSLLASTA